MSVPYTFATATGSLPLSQLDANFATGIVIGNTTVALGDTITTINNLTLANVTVTSASFSNVTLTGTTTVSGTTTVFSGTGARIQGDFSNATLANRTGFQDKTTNNGSDVFILPNGTSSTAGIYGFANSTPTNSAYVGVGFDSGAARIICGHLGSGSSVPLQLVVNNAEVARFDTSGRFCLGVTSGATIAGAVNALGYASRSGSAGSFSGNVYNLFWTGSAVQLWLDTANLGAISITSDYRIKKNVSTQTLNGVDRINALRPIVYEFKDIEMFKPDGVVREGFIAHELSDVIPSAVDGVKDGLTSDGKIQPQTLRLDPIIAVLTKAVQELSARVAALESA
jgi:hypothetical protein